MTDEGIRTHISYHTHAHTHSSSYDSLSFHIGQGAGCLETCVKKCFKSINHFHKGPFPKSYGCQQDMINCCKFNNSCLPVSFMYFVFLYLYFWLAIIPGPCCWPRLGQPSPTQITMAAMNDLPARPYNLASHDKSL